MILNFSFLSPHLHSLPLFFLKCKPYVWNSADSGLFLACAHVFRPAFILGEAVFCHSLSVDLSAQAPKSSSAAGFGSVRRV